jgi:DNA polymerase-1
VLKPWDMKTLVLIDGHSLAYRMYFALERTGMATRAKQPTWAVYGFFNALFALLKQVSPDAMAVAFDVGKHTFRNDLYPDYKAHRASMPDEMKSQMGLIQQGVRALGIPIYELPGFEADDVIGTLSRQAAEHGDVLVKILTGDQDAFQLVDDGRVQVLIPPRTPKEGLSVYDRAGVIGKWGIPPELVVDFKGLKGDTSDNIPGVPGVGDKTAVKLLTQYGSLEGVYQNVGLVNGAKLKESLMTYRDQAFLSKQLATIDRHAPVQVDLEHCHLAMPDKAAWRQFLETCEFRSFLAQGDALIAPFLGADAATATPTDSPSACNECSVDLITTEEGLSQWVQAITQHGVLALDLETTGLDVLTAGIVGVALATGPGLSVETVTLAHPITAQSLPLNRLSVSEPADTPPQVAYIPIGHENTPDQLSWETVKAALAPVLANASIPKLVHNLKFERNVLQTHGCPLNGLVFDTMIASYVMDPDRRHGLKQLGPDLLGVSMDEITTLIGSGKKEIPFSQVPVDQAAPYAGKDAQVTWQLAVHFARTLPETRHPLLYWVELPAAAVLASMERTGVCLDTAYLGELSAQLAVGLAQAETDIYALAGLEFNLNSPKQVGEVLFERLDIQPLRKTPTKTAYSTDAKVLEQLAPDYPIIQKLLDYRGLFKLKSTYVDALPALVHPQTGRLHTHFNQTVTATGRLSSSNPNLQNIPIRTELGRKIRQAFVPQPGWVLLSADYSQIELRMLAHYSNDPHLVAAFNAGEDVHTTTAALVFNVPKEHVTKEMRYQAKTVNFGVIYGQSAHGLSQQLGITRAEAQAFIEAYFARYDHVKACIEKVIADAHATGTATTLMGRVRNLSEGLASSNRGIREFSERAAFNTPLQGSAADLMKLAMVRLQAQLPQYPAHLLLQVHDELVLEVAPEAVEPVKALVLEAMQLDQPLRVPLAVDIHTGPTWMEA